LITLQALKEADRLEADNEHLRRKKRQLEEDNLADQAMHANASQAADKK
jgi:hypothetical protein